MLDETQMEYAYNAAADVTDAFWKALGENASNQVIMQTAQLFVVGLLERAHNNLGISRAAMYTMFARDLDAHYQTFKSFDATD